MNRPSDNLEAFFKLCKKYSCWVTDCVVHEDAIVNSSVTVARWDAERQYMYGNSVLVDTVLVREGRMDEIELLLIECAMEEMFE